MGVKARRWEPKMKKRVKFAVVSGPEYDESMVRMDYNTAKVSGNIRYGRYFVFYKGVYQWSYVYYKDIVWAYHWLEDAGGRLRRELVGNGIHSIMLVTKEQKRIGIPVESDADAVRGLDIIQKYNRFIDIGFSKEKEGRYL